MNEPALPVRRRWVDRALKLALPGAILAVMMAVLLGELASVDRELQLVIPPAAGPAERVPMQALLFDRLSDPRGPRLLAAPVQVRLLDGDRQIAQAELRPSEAGGAFGHLDLPQRAMGELTVEAEAAAADEDGIAAAAATVTTTLRVRPDPPEAPSSRRLAHGVRQFELGAIEVLDPQAAPSAMDLRVVGGACVPDSLCELLVWVGEPAAALRVADAASVEPLHDEPTEPSAGLVSVPVTVRGPEARFVLEAVDGGRVLARRSVQLPIALATPGVQLDGRVLPQGAAPRLTVEVLGERPAVIVDAYRDGRWVRTSPARLGSEPLRPDLGSLEPGLWRLQVRADPYGAERAAARMVVVADASSDGDAADVRAALEAIAALGGRADAPAGPPALRLAWAAASLEESVRAIPSGVSGRQADLARLQQRQSRLRLVALGAILLGLLAVGLLFVRRGIDAALEAQRVMDATGDPELASARYRRRTLLSALTIVATVLLAFLGAAALLVARGRLLE